MTNGYLAPVLSWYAEHARELPWRLPGASPWAILVSEVMLQQTPVARVLPAYEAWLARWPTPRSLAACAPGDAVRQWGRLGYPRRALRLHAAARIITERYAGQVPAAHEALAGLPGVGSYTAAAVASFAFGQRHAVLDTNVRRVLARLVRGAEFPPRSTSAAESRLAESLLPADRGEAARWSVAVMELGALVCTAAHPRCSGCPVAAECSWRRAGSPAGASRRRHRVTRAATGSAGVRCWPRSAAPAARSGPSSSRRPGRTTSSGPARSTGWSPMAWPSRCRMAGSRSPASASTTRPSRARIQGPHLPGPGPAGLAHAGPGSAGPGPDPWRCQPPVTQPPASQRGGLAAGSIWVSATRRCAGPRPRLRPPRSQSPLAARPARNRAWRRP